MADVLASLRAVTYVYRSPRRPVTALHGVDLDVVAGELVAVMGPSGCGKSTLLGVVSLVSAPTSGDVEVMGRPAPPGASARAAVRNRHIGILRQDLALVGRATALANVAIPLEYASPRSPAGSAARGLSTPWRRWASPTSPGSGPPACPAGSASGWPSRGPW